LSNGVTLPFSRWWTVVAVAKDLRGMKELNNSQFLSRVVLRNEYCFQENVSINRLIMGYCGF
jgi:hypothetical protein